MPRLTVNVVDDNNKLIGKTDYPILIDRINNSVDINLSIRFRIINLEKGGFYG